MNLVFIKKLGNLIHKTKINILFTLSTWCTKRMKASITFNKDAIKNI